jgi:hypothetical protein
LGNAGEVRCDRRPDIQEAGVTEVVTVIKRRERPGNGKTIRYIESPLQPRPVKPRLPVFYHMMRRTEAVPGCGSPLSEMHILRVFSVILTRTKQGCGVGFGRNFRWSRSRHIFTDSDFDLSLKS